MKEQIIIFGGAGFIGSHLCDSLITNNYIIVVDNLSIGRIENIKHLIDNEYFEFHQLDINSIEIENLFAKNKIKTVYHLAANSDIAISHNNPDIDFNNTLLTTYNILKLMKKYLCKEIVFASSSAIYGEVNFDINEDQGPLFPHSHYGAGKLASEAFISSFCVNYDMKSWLVRFPNVIGERCTHGVIYDFIKKLKNDPEKLEILGNGLQNKPYLYVKDLICAINFIKEKSDDQINYFNVGVNTKTKVNEIANILIKCSGLNPKISYTGGDRGWIGDVPEFQYDLSKVKKLGWKPKYTSNEAVEISIIKTLENWMQ